MRHLVVILTLVLSRVDACAADPAPDVTGTINRGLAFLAKDSLAWKESKTCYECHHAPFTIWALNEGKKQGYTVDEKALADITSWVVGDAYLSQLLAKRPAPKDHKETAFNEAPLLLALAMEAGNTKATQDILKKMLASVLNDQGADGSWKRVNEARPILSSPDTLTMWALLALTAPNAPDMGNDGLAAREKALQWLRTVTLDGELQPVALRLILWRRLGRPDSEWKPLVEQIRSVQNEDGGWAQVKNAKSDAYATGQALYALGEAGVKPGDQVLGRAHGYLSKTQRQDGSWAMTSRAIMANGKVATRFEPIIHAGSAWAVMGLVRSAQSPNELTRRASVIKPRADENRWQQIPWITDVNEGLRQARAEQRPVLLWTIMGEPLDEC